jgi:hypothetical protein
MQVFTSLPITSLYAAVLALFFLPITMRVALYRGKVGIHVGHGENERLLRLNRGQQNFTETAPMALLLLVLMEMAGASAPWLHTLGLMLTLGRISHYCQITHIVQHLLFRGAGMLATLLVYLFAACWLLINAANL